MAGLMAYLQGPGRRDEHEHPHLVAGDAGVMAWYSGAELSKPDAMRLARYLDRPSAALDVEVNRGRYEQVEVGREPGGQRVLERRKTGETDAHVYHVALSARAEEGRLGDETWQAIAVAFVDKMGLAGDPRPAQDDEAREPRPSTRWAAVHHGLSEQGNDHIHLVVNLVAEDGSKVNVHRDFVRAREVCRELEEEFGLMPLHPNEYELTRTYARAEYERGRLDEQAAGSSSRIPWPELSDEQQHALMGRECGTSAEWQRVLASREQRATPDTAEAFTHQGARESMGRARARAAYQQQVDGGAASVPWGALSPAARSDQIRRAMPAEDPTKTLARTVRACAAASENEAEFVRRLRQHRLLVRPRFAQGRTDVVEGYSVAQRPDAGERPIWRGGNRLGKDLSLPRLREEWAGEDHPAAAASAATAAVAEWTAAQRKQPPAAPGRETVTPGPDLWQQVAAELTAMREQLRSIPVDDPETWARVARQSAGALSAWSTSTEPEPGPLAATADALAASAQTPRRAERPRTTVPSIAGSAYLLLAASHGGPGADLAVVKAFMNLTKAVYDMRVASGEALRARRLHQVVRGQLETVARSLAETQAPATQTAAAAAAVAIARQGSSSARDIVDPARRPAAPQATPPPTRRPGPASPGRDDSIER